MQAFVYGNCQAMSYGAALRHLLEVDAVHVAGVDPYERVGDCELVFVQSEFLDHISLRGGFLEVGDKRVIRLPTFYFAGLFPDAIIERVSGKPLLSPAGVYNSSITLHGFLQGYSIEETVALFNRDSYRTLRFDRYWDEGRAAMVADLDGCELDGEALFGRIAALGKFASSSHHQTLAVSEAVVAALLSLHDLPARGDGQPQPDPLAPHGDWPIYPGLLPGLDLPRSFDFRFADPLPGETGKAPIPLPDFVRRSFEGYASWPPGSIRSERLTAQAALYAQLRPRGAFPAAGPTAPDVAARHVYAELPASSFWRRAVDPHAAATTDVVVAPRWAISRNDRIATAGSCFAQNIARTLRTMGRDVLNAEPVPRDMGPDEAARRHYGIFSARYGNVYTARQLLQLVRRAIGTFTPADVAWRRPDGRFVDPFRPQIEPDGFATPADLVAETDRHLRAVLGMLESMDVLVFTLGMTETWEAVVDGAVFPLAPGIVAGRMDPARYRFVNFTASQVRADLRRALNLLRDINPQLRVLLTVSPVSLIATFERRHVVTASVYSKSVLRVAAEEIAADHAFVDYFPSYEMVAGPQAGGAWYEPDRRAVSPAGVAHVMNCFARHYLVEGPVLPGIRPAAPPDGVAAEIAARSRYLCDEERLDAVRGVTSPA